RACGDLMIYSNVHMTAMTTTVAHPPAASRLSSIHVNTMIKENIRPIIIDPSAARGDAFLFPKMAYIIGPSVPADTPEIPIHIRSPMNCGGLSTSNEATTPTARTAYLLIRSEILSTFSSFTFTLHRLTHTFFNISFATIVD